MLVVSALLLYLIYMVMLSQTHTTYHHHHRDAKRSAGASSVAIVRQNGRSFASCRALVAVTTVSRQIWWVQVVDGRPQVRLHSCEGRLHPSSWCRFVGSCLLVHRFEV